MSEMYREICHEASVSHESFRLQWVGPAVHLNATHKNRNSLKAVFPLTNPLTVSPLTVH